MYYLYTVEDVCLCAFDIKILKGFGVALQVLLINVNLMLSS